MWRTYLEGEIYEKYHALGLIGYGIPTTDEYTDSHQMGVAVDFLHWSGYGATIAYSPNVKPVTFSGYIHATEGEDLKHLADPKHIFGPGAHETHGVVREQWLRNGGLEQGYPITDELWTPNGENPDERETFSIYENPSTGWLYEHYLIDGEGTGSKMLYQVPNVGKTAQADSVEQPDETPSPVQLNIHYADDPVLHRSVATNTYDVTIKGNVVAIHTSDSQSLVIDVDGQRFTYDPSVIANIDVTGVGDGSTLTVDDHSHATAQYLAYGLNFGQVSINSRRIDFDSGVQNVVLWTSDLVANSVDVHATGETTKAWINAGAAPTTVNAHLHEGFGQLLSDVVVTGNANTTLNTYDEPGIRLVFSPLTNEELLLDGEDLGLGGGDTVDGEFAPPPSTNQYVTTNSVYDDRTPGKVIYQGISGLAVHGDNGTDRITVLSTSVPVTLFGGWGDTTFVLGNTSFGTDQLQSQVNVVGNPEALRSVLVVDDHPRPVGTYSKHYELDESAVHLQQQVDVQYSGLSQLVLKTAVWGAVQVDVNGSAAATPVEIDLAAQVSTVNVNFHSLDGHQLLGDVTVVGNGNTKLHTYDWTTESSTYTIRDNSVADEGNATVYYSGLANLTVMGGDGDDLFSIFGTAAGVVTNIGGGYGSDEFAFMDDNYTMDSIQGEVYLDGEPDGSWNIDYVVFYDYFNTFEQTYTFTADTMQRSGMADVHYADMCEVILYSSCLAASWINVESVDADMLLNLAVSDGDTVYIGQPLGDGTATLSGILGAVDIGSMGGAPRVIIDSSADVDPHETSSGVDGWGDYLDGLAPGRLYFNGFSADEIEFIPGGDITALDAFYALLGSVEE